MELRQLRHLLAVVAQGSFSKAAEAVHLTQPALSRSVQALEAEVGAALLDRSRGEITPTDVGRVVLAHARQMDSLATELRRDIALTQGLELGELRIGVGPFGGSALVGPVVGDLVRLHPGLRIQTVVAPWQELPERARARALDLIVVELSQVQEHTDFATRALGQHAGVLVCRPGHPLTRLRRPRLADMFDYPLVGPSLPGHALAGLLQAAPAALRERLQREGPLAVECDSAAILKDVLRNSDAVAIMPRFIVAHELAAAQLVVVPGVDIGVRARFGAAWLKKRSLSGAAAKFVELLATRDAPTPLGEQPTAKRACR